MTWHRIRMALAALGVATLIASPIYSARHFVDSRNEKRQANSAQLKAARNAATAAAIKVSNNAARIEVLADANAKTCNALNVDAGRLNKVLDYFELYAKSANPGPGTDAFFNGLPRPAIIRCTPKSTTP